MVRGSRFIRLALSLLVVSIALSILPGLSQAQRSAYVRGYWRSDGSYVAPHYRTVPDGNFWNNWSTYPNVNPYTGQLGTRRTPSYSWTRSNYGYRSNPSPSYRYYSQLYGNAYDYSYRRAPSPQIYDRDDDDDSGSDDDE